MNTKAEVLLPLRGACVPRRFFCLWKRLIKVEGRRLFVLGPRHPSREGLAASRPSRWSSRRGSGCHRASMRPACARRTRPGPAPSGLFSSLSKGRRSYYAVATLSGPEGKERRGCSEARSARTRNGGRPSASSGPDWDTAPAASFSAVMTYFQAVICPFEALSQYRHENENLAIGSAPLNSM